jgi:hypothetical protein
MISSAICFCSETPLPSFPDVCVLVLAYKLRRKSIMAVLTSGARSCWVQ